LLRYPYGVERDIDRPRLVDDGVEVACDGLFVERIDLRGLSGSAGSRDFFGECLDGAEVSSGQKDACAFAGECAGHRAPDRSGRPVDDRILVFEQHDVLRSPPSGSCGFGR
jgi:hypothetical protein